MHVAVDGLAARSPAPGVRRYLTEIWRAMPEAAPDVCGTLVGGDARDAAGLGLRHLPVRGPVINNLHWAAWTLPRALARVGADVFHAPAYTAPLWGRAPLVLTIHDVSYARQPEWYPHLSDPLRQAFYRRSACRADRIITDSRHSRDEIVQAYGIAADRITVVPLGVAGRWRADATIAREPLVLHVGDVHTRRNLGIVLDAVLALRAAGGALAALRLVLIGRDLGAVAALQAQARAAGAPEALEHHAGIDDEALLQWYRRAAVFAYPSRYEGFGLPLLEAMACGTPVVASRATCIPEVAGEAAQLVSPDDLQAWCTALRAVVADPAAAARWSAAGLARAAGFSWVAAARATADVWRETARRGRAS